MGYCYVGEGTDLNPHDVFSGVDQRTCENWGGSYSEKKPSGCHVLVAACEVRGVHEQPNAEGSLIFQLLAVGNVLGRGLYLREKVLNQLPSGRPWVETYDRHAAALVPAVQRRGDLARRVLSLAVHISPLVDAINKVHSKRDLGKSANLKVSGDVIIEALSLIDALVDEAGESERLSADAESLRELVRGFAGKTPRQVHDTFARTGSTSK